MGINPHWQFVIRPAAEKYNPRYVKKTFKSARVKVMVRACFTGDRWSDARAAWNFWIHEQGESTRLKIYFYVTAI